MSDCFRFQEASHQREEQDIFFWIIIIIIFNSLGFGDEPVEYGNSPVPPHLFVRFTVIAYVVY